MLLKIPFSRNYDLEEIKSHFTIEEIASEYAELELSGNDFIALCPFHDDLKTKSLRIYTNTDSFFCFGCQRGGSIFDFIALAENVSFFEAVELLAKRAGVFEKSESLPDLKVTKSNYAMDFSKFRDEVEKRLTLQIKNIFLKNKACFFINNPYIIEEIKKFWDWYDKEQLSFDTELYNYTRTGGREVEIFDSLTKKMHGFFVDAVKKLETIE